MRNARDGAVIASPRFRGDMESWNANTSEKVMEENVMEERVMKNSISSSILVLCSAVLVSSGVSAAGFDGSANLVCSSVDVVGCTDGPTCLQAHARDFDLPDFVFVDFSGKVVRATDESGLKEVSPIKSISKSEKQIVLQGFENHRGWTLAIDRETGRMAVTSTESEVSFMIFGACTAL
jgi:hypothetical protein